MFGGSLKARLLRKCFALRGGKNILDLDLIDRESEMIYAYSFFADENKWHPLEEGNVYEFSMFKVKKSTLVDLTSISNQKQLELTIQTTLEKCNDS